MDSWRKMQSLAVTTISETEKKEQKKTEDGKMEKTTVHQTWFAEAAILGIRASCCFHVGTSVHAKTVKAFSITALEWCVEL